MTMLPGRQTILRALLFFLLPLFVVQCGGGTAGTGGQRFEGKIATRTGTPVVNATVMIRETGDSTLTDTQGKFLIETEEDLDQCQLDINGSGFSGTVAVSGIPDQAESIDLDLSFDESSGDFFLDDVDFEDDDGQVVEADDPTDDSGSGDGGDDGSTDAGDDASDDSNGGLDGEDAGSSDDGTGDDGNGDDSGGGNEESSSDGSGSGEEEPIEVENAAAGYVR